MTLVVRARWAVRGKDAGSVRIVDTGATEDAVLAPFSAAGRLSGYTAKAS